MSLGVNHLAVRVCITHCQWGPEQSTLLGASGASHTNGMKGADAVVHGALSPLPHPWHAGKAPPRSCGLLVALSPPDGQVHTRHFLCSTRIGLRVTQTTPVGSTVLDSHLSNMAPFSLVFPSLSINTCGMRSPMWGTELG